MRLIRDEPFSYRQVEDMLITFDQQSIAGSSRHLEYLDDGVFLLFSEDSKGNLVCREMLPYRMMETSES